MNHHNRNCYFYIIYLTSLRYGLEDDCPISMNLFNHCRIVAGASISGARLLTAQKVKSAISWIGGRHHAKKSEASGFCYVNDIVLAILTMRERFKRVLYIDFDIHHGDGVEEAFYYSSDVCTLSLHKYSPGFYPHTGSLDSIGKGRGKYTSVNIPLKSGITDFSMVACFDLLRSQPTAIMAKVRSRNVMIFLEKN